MIPLPYRLSLRQERTFFDHAHRFSTRYFLVYQGDASDQPLLAVVVPKKKLAKASDRALARRRTESVLYQLRHQLPAHKLVFYYSATTPVPTEELHRDLLQLTHDQTH